MPTIISLAKINSRKIILGVLLSAFICTVNAREDQLIVDQYMSPFAGTALNLSIIHTYADLDDRYLVSSEGKVTVPWALGRIGKLVVEDIMDEFLMVFQHEVFGHGYRLREFDFNHIGYYIGIGHGYTSFPEDEFEVLPYPKRAAISAAGMEADAVLSAQIRENWIMQNKVDRRDAWFYFVTSLDQAEYIWGTSDASTSLGNDVNSYVSEVNLWYGNNNLTKRKLRQYEYWEIFDPSLYIGLYSVGDYILKGTPFMPMTMLDIHKYRYMFSPRLLLAPYGPEFQLQNYVLTPKSELVQVNIRYGNNSGRQSYGLDLFMKPIWHYKNWHFGNKLYLWKQLLFLKQNTAADVHSRLGFAEFVSAEYKVYKCLSAVGEFGYKTAGYAQGIPLGNSWVWRFGMSFQY